MNIPDAIKYLRSKPSAKHQAIADLFKNMEWRDIKSAPDAEDNQQIWVYGGPYKTPTLVFSDGSYWNYASSQGASMPTHWVELTIPVPPRKE